MMKFNGLLTAALSAGLVSWPQWQAQERVFFDRHGGYRRHFIIHWRHVGGPSDFEQADIEGRSFWQRRNGKTFRG